MKCRFQSLLFGDAQGLLTASSFMAAANFAAVSAVSGVSGVAGVLGSKADLRKFNSKSRRFALAVMLLVTAVNLLVLGLPEVLAQQVPLRDFFERRQFINMKLSPDAKHIAFSYEQGNEVRLAVMTTAERKVVNHFSFGDSMHVQEFLWATNMRLVM
ncbi:MAG: hypothetical protein EBX72_09365, partial [Betaproteobacteria bacterium]|nr:hypothetical protein [Betaproteobacteria bacterium]